MATSAIRFYEEAGLLPEPERTASGYRAYDQSVIDRLSFIRTGQGVGLTLNELPRGADDPRPRRAAMPGTSAI